MEGLFWLLTKPIPARCRSRRLRAAGVRPAEAAGYARRVPAHQAKTTQPDSIWAYTPGNSPDHAVCVERGDWAAAYQEDPPVPFLFKSLNERSGLYEWHTAWHRCARWRCVCDATEAEPGPGVREWAMTSLFEELLIRLSCDYDATHGLYTLTAEVRSGGDTIDDWHESIPAHISWTRETTGTQDGTQTDGQFNTEHGEHHVTRKSITFGDSAIGVTRDGDGKIVSGPQAVRFTLTMRMRRDDAFDPLEDSEGSRLTDVSLSPLYVDSEEGMVTISKTLTIIPH